MLALVIVVKSMSFLLWDELWRGIWANKIIYFLNFELFEF